MSIAVINSVEIDDQDVFPDVEESDLCPCGAESDFAGHGFRNGELYSEYYCKACYNRRKS